MVRLFGEYDPVTGERLSFGDRLLAVGMLLLSVVPPAKGAGIAGKAAIKGAKALDTASTLLSKVKHVVRSDQIKGFFQTIYHQVVRAPLLETARLFKKQWDEFVESIASVSWQPAYAGVGPASRGWMSGFKNEVKDATFHMIKRVEGETVGKGIISSTTK
ncbi:MULTISPECIES: pre-toxin TG domain-containing protein [Geobacillus]|uniref:pre-toxin TG domain-containing protein n=1 Tax=Geobacillus TaxID=129337 RepID=UPI00148D3851|nr:MULTISPECIES: pre-toxin TG domain-containing protein [Geobacillus]